MNGQAPRVCEYRPQLAGRQFGCSQPYGHSGPHIFRAEQTDFQPAIDRIAKLETDLSEAVAALRDIAEHGLRFDLNPTHVMGDWEQSEKFWHEYFKRADTSIRERARAIVARLGG